MNALSRACGGSVLTYFSLLILKIKPCQQVKKRHELVYFLAGQRSNGLFAGVHTLERFNLLKEFDLLLL